ncbi:aminotransferase class III-fold pyridoxal phosphate-dependent enzyme [Bradyrhizobium sp. AZCC 1610]|uniref:aminotransferase class III-fold pyridoxal phosphate-dependent enzyme n=1 Tax=Bradyrhizobium sp. AZCC 1610 TaxID=3117020 RepID=UPI003FA5C0EB
MTIKSLLRSAARVHEPRAVICSSRICRPIIQIVDRGEGPYLFDTDGRRYFDGLSGAMTANLGHGLREIADKMADQAATVAFTFRKPVQQCCCGKVGPQTLRTGAGRP